MLSGCCCWVTKVHLFCDPEDCSLPGFSVHGISQARILEWVAIFRCWVPDSKLCVAPDPGIEPWSPTLQEDSLPSELPGKLCVAQCFPIILGFCLLF